MPVDLPGFYFDAERNRYFPISSKPEEPPPPPPAPPALRKNVTPIPKLLWNREICSKNPATFGHDVGETFSVRPRIWRFNFSLTHSAVGWGYCSYFNSDAVFLGSPRGLVLVMAERKDVSSSAGPPSLDQGIRKDGDSIVTAIKTLSTRQDPHKVAMYAINIARLGNASGGCLQVLDLDTLIITADIKSRLTVFTADIFPCGTKASLGTHTRAEVVDLRTGQRSWIYQCPFSVLSQKIDSTGNIVVCGFRNGCILSLDARQRLRFSKTDISKSIRMESSVSSLLLHPSDETYLIASDLSNNIRLYDRRLVGKGYLRSFDGHRNTSSWLDLGIDPTGTLLMSGAEDDTVRIWSLRTAKLLHTQTGCGRSPYRLTFRGPDDREPWSAWIATRGELHYLHPWR